MKKHKFS